MELASERDGTNSTDAVLLPPPENIDSTSSAPPNITKAPVSLFKKKQQEEIEFLSSAKIFMSHLTTKNEKKLSQSATTADDVFSQYVAAELRSITSETSREIAKLKIMQVLNKAKMNQIANSQQHEKNSSQHQVSQQVVPAKVTTSISSGILTSYPSLNLQVECQQNQGQANQVTKSSGHQQLLGNPPPSFKQHQQSEDAFMHTSQKGQVGAVNSTRKTTDSSARYCGSQRQFESFAGIQQQHAAQGS